MLNGLLFEWVPWIFNQTTQALEFTKRVALAAYTEATVEKEWLLLHSIQVPVSSTLFPDVPAELIKWRVKVNPTEFSDSSDTVHMNHISYLSLTVLAGDNRFDLTDWVNEVQWCGRVEPSLVELFSIWCCEMGKPYFHLIPTADVEVITELGDLFQKPLV